MFNLPKTATAPFCPSEVRGTIAVAWAGPSWKKILRFAGPGLLVSVGYMDPGNWATDIQAGSEFGYRLLFVVVLSSLAAIVLQCLSARLGIATGKDLARLSRENLDPLASLGMWLLAEIAIIACDQAEAIILALVVTIGICFAAELALLDTDWGAVAQGLVPSVSTLASEEPLYLAIGILGATVMPHNLYLHSSIVQTRVTRDDERGRLEAIRFTRGDTIVSLLLALMVNAAILILAGSAFHYSGNTSVADIEDAYHLLAPIAGTAAAGFLFAFALLASGQSSTFTGTIAGQIILEGFLELQIPCWQRRLITRGRALAPALVGVMLLGDHAVGRLLVISQVVLRLQLPYALYPLIRVTGYRTLMGSFANDATTTIVAWTLFFAITAANLWLVLQVLGIV